MRTRGFLLATVGVIVIFLSSCGSLAVGEVALQKAPSTPETTLTPDTTSSTTKERTTTPSTTKEATKTPSPTTKEATKPASTTKEATTTPTPPKPSNFVTEWGGSGTKWGESGDDDGQFSEPRGVATDAAGNVYVADTYNYRIQKFDPNGTFIAKWGESGSADGQFVAPRGVAADALGNVFVVDADAGIPVFRAAVARTQKFDSKGKFLSKWGESGSADGQFDSSAGIAADAAGNVYVADTGNDRIQKFGTSGAFVAKWGERGYASSADGGDGQFYDPYGIATDPSGNVYVADGINNRIQKFDSSGNFITKWGERGEDDGQFSGPRGIATDSAGNVYVVDDDNNRVQVFDSSGRFLTKWGESGNVASGAEADGRFYNPSYIAIDSAGNVYVADSGNDRIQKFSPPPTRLAPPAAPSDLNVRAVDSGSIQVEWDDNSANEDGFEISNGETSVGTGVTTYTWNGLAPGTYMCFEVRAFNSAGNSAFTTADSPDDNCATTPSTGTEGETSSSGTTGTTEENGPTGTTGTDGEGEDRTPEENGEVLEEVTDAMEDTFQNISRGRLPDTGGGWAVLLLLGAALVSGGGFLIRLSRPSSR